MYGVLWARGPFLSQCLRRLFSVTSNVGDVFKTVFPRERLILPGAGIGVAKNTAEFLYFLKSGGVDFQKYRSRWFFVCRSCVFSEESFVLGLL
jgi:hypothetical protein